MTQPEQLQLPCPYSNNITSLLDEAQDYEFSIDADINHSEFSPHFTSILETPNTAFSIPSLGNMFSDDYADIPLLINELILTLPADDLSFSFKDSEISPIDRENEWASTLTGMDISYLKTNSSPGQSPESQINSSQSMYTSDTSMDKSSIQQSLSLPAEYMVTDNQLSVLHLVMAYEEAMDKGQTELAEVIMIRINDKVSPMGELAERLLYYMSQSLDKQLDYLKLESSKNFYTAFKAFYQIFPYGRFAHFAANLAILEAMPHNAEIIHIFDFDMGDGIQWCTVIEALGRQRRELRLISIKWSGGDCCHHSRWRFEETKRQLYDHASHFGLKLKVEEMELHNLMSEIKQMSKTCIRREWFVFNCMIGLPHMGRVKSRRHVMEFLMVAREFLLQTATSGDDFLGIITLGDGDVWEKVKNSSSFSSFLDDYLVHYQALLESIESNFPVHLVEARTAMECLFVAPFVSCLALLKKWEEMKECCDLQSKLGFEGWKVSKESLMEAKEMVREGENLYEVRVEGETNNEMVLEWRGIPLVKFSCWRN